MQLDNNLWAWSKIPERYVKESVSKVEEYLDEFSDAHWQLSRKKAKKTFVGYYTPEMDDTPDLEKDLESWYQ